MERLPSAPQVLPQLTSLNRVVFDLIELYQPAFASKRLASGLDLDPVLPLTWIDAPQLERALANLLRRAIKHTRDGDLILCRTTADTDWAELTIGGSGAPDSGDGSDLFTPPLADCSIVAPDFDASKAIIAAHGGGVWVDDDRSTSPWYVVRLPAIEQAHAQLLEELVRGMRSQYELMTTLSFGLRSPLNVIVGYNDLLLDGTFGRLSTEQADALQRIGRGAQALLDLINDTLDLGRTTGGPLLEIEGLLQPNLDQAVERSAVRQWLALENVRLAAALDHSKQLESEFATTMSHQLRIPLNAIIGYEDLLLEEAFGALSPEQVNVLRRARESALELLAAINTHLDGRWQRLATPDSPAAHAGP